MNTDPNRHGHFQYLMAYSIREITFGALEDWSLWLADRGLSAKDPAERDRGLPLVHGLAPRARGDGEARLTRSPLFVNPRTGKRWSHWALRDRWIRTATSVELPHVGLFEGTNHSMATDAARRNASERALQPFLGQSDVRSTRRYARLSQDRLRSL